MPVECNSRQSLFCLIASPERPLLLEFLLALGLAVMLSLMSVVVEYSLWGCG